MRKSARPASRPKAKAAASQLSRPGGTPAPGLLDRILDTPHLAHVIPRLQPEVLYRVIQTCGLEDCGEIVALATAGQMATVFDLDLWRAARPGLDEHFDAERFGVWLEVLLESGDEVAAQMVSEMDADLVIAALAQHVRVLDVASGVRTGDGISAGIGGYRVVARQEGWWDAISAVLLALAAAHQTFFHRVMRGCRGLSNSAPEIDGLDDLLSADAQVMFDVALDREKRRERQGYATPAQSRAFLQMARQLPLGHKAAPPGNPVARAYFRAIEWTDAPDAGSAAGRLPAAAGEPAPEDAQDAVAAFVDVLVDAGVIAQPPRALLDAPHSQTLRLAHIQAHLQSARDRGEADYALRSQELAYLANTLAAGSAIHSRPLTPQEASEAAVAVCNLGLENWPSHWPPADDLVCVFQVGWTVLHADVCMATAERLIDVLTAVRCVDRDTQAGLNVLRLEMKKHWRAGAPWRAAGALDAIEILDMLACAALVGLIAEFPVMHAGLAAAPGSGARSFSATAFEFISGNRQIASVRAFMQALPETLRG